MALSDRDHALRVVYAYLENISTDFFSQYDENTINSSTAYGLKEFSKSMKRELVFF